MSTTKYFLTISILLICYTQQSRGSTIADALQALEDFQSFLFTKSSELSPLMSAQIKIFYDELVEIQESIFAEISEQSDKVRSKIQIITETVANSTGRDVSECIDTAYEDLDDVVYELQEKTWMCYGRMINQVNFKMYFIWNTMSIEEDYGYNCDRNLVEQCAIYENQACVDSVLEIIQGTRNKTAERFELLKIDMINTAGGTGIPCRGIILKDLISYTNLILKFVSVCLESLTGGIFDFKCYY